MLMIILYRSSLQKRIACLMLCMSFLLFYLVIGYLYTYRVYLLVLTWSWTGLDL